MIHSYFNVIKTVYQPYFSNNVNQLLAHSSKWKKIRSISFDQKVDRCSVLILEWKFMYRDVSFSEKNIKCSLKNSCTPLWHRVQRNLQHSGGFVTHFKPSNSWIPTRGNPSISLSTWHKCKFWPKNFHIDQVKKLHNIKGVIHKLQLLWLVLKFVEKKYN